ncbi:MAG: hypothetical protein HY207_13805 [Nitrospirae bacterium]|nr:hypothetical protein [Nitrospirota bacterium]
MGIHILMTKKRLGTALLLLAASVLWGLFPLASLSLASAAPTDLIFIAAKNFPADSLTLDEIQNIYLGKKRVVGGSVVVAVDQGEAEPIKLEFLDRVIHLSHAEYKAQLLKRHFQEGAATPKFEPNSAAVLREVANTEGAVGYVYKSDIESNSGVKVLAIVPTK